jgi:hypothetical protein
MFYVILFFYFWVGAGVPFIRIGKLTMNRNGFKLAYVCCKAFPAQPSPIELPDEPHKIRLLAMDPVK